MQDSAGGLALVINISRPDNSYTWQFFSDPEHIRKFYNYTMQSVLHCTVNPKRHVTEIINAILTLAFLVLQLQISLIKCWVVGVNECSSEHFASDSSRQISCRDQEQDVHGATSGNRAQI